MDQQTRIRKVKEIASLGDAFRAILGQNSGPYRDRDSYWLQALQFYLHGYAYERQGRSPEYSAAAVEAVCLATGADLANPDSGFPQRAWDAFLQILRLTPDGKGGNPGNNPLFPRDGAGKEAVTGLILKLDDFDYNLVRTVLTILESGATRTAHTFLCQIRGTGSKISSLFLRDIVLIYDLAIDPHDPLLQPVDIWVRRLVRLLMDVPADVAGDQKDNYSSDAKIAEALICLSREASVSPLTLNQGAWYFGSQIAGTKSGIVRYVEGELSLSDAVSRKVSLLQDEINALQSLPAQSQ